MRSINENWKDDEEQIKQNTLLLDDLNVQSLFSGYYYDSEAPQPITTESVHKESSLGPSSQQTADTAGKK